ncbi:DUF3152 domain-containing protein [Actinopolyspora mortivallis]|uniref:DUF3152 domain-containing protein n=1 Tax=Actinopolyspora mortivallis TaxID=33906 RepID=UPI0003641375|nr:DUF3152 domain-containing protein [Actinopolyspora mortivallis]
MRSGDGGRHRGDEPLAASWYPSSEREDRAGGGTGGRRRARRVRRYGWGIYAIPALLVLTVFAVVGMPRDAPGTRSGSVDGAGQTSRNDTAPVVTEGPKDGEYDSGLKPPELPPGAPIPRSGSGTFEVLPGRTEAVGSGRLYEYTVEVESGVRLLEGNDSFARLTEQTLSDPRSWTNPEAGGISLRRVGANGPAPDFRVTLVSQHTAREVCGYDEGLPYDSSCRIGERVYINAARWVRGATSFDGDIGTYRRYVVNHEVGHFFGNGHVGCPEQGQLAPVMMQQTFSLSNDVLHRLNERVSQGTEIPENGFVCKPNAWPFPLGEAGK